MSTPVLRDVLRFLGSTCAARGEGDLTDADLLERFLTRREEAAFALLVQRHGPMVLGVCRRVLHDRHTAEDAFQATFLILVRRAASIRKQESVGSWLHGVARRVAAKARAQAAARSRRERRATEMPRTQPLDDLTWQELRGVLDEEIGRLPEKYRAALVHCALEGQSYDQAARELGWPKNSLAKRLTRARELLRGQLARRGIALTGAALALALGEEAAGAPVTALLTMNTVRAAVCAAAGKCVGVDGLSARAAALAEEAVRPALGARRKLVLLLLALALGGAGLAAHGALPERSPPAQEKQAQTPAGKDPSRGPVEPHPPALDVYGDPLPDGASGRLGTVRFRGSARVSGLAFAPGGKVLASSGIAGFGICLWDATTGRPLHRLGVPFISESRPAFAPDGQTLVATGKFRGQANKLYLFEVATGRERRRLEGAAGASLDCVAFSPDGRTVAAGESGGPNPAVVLWDVVADRVVRRLEGHTDLIRSVAFSPDGKLLASGADDQTVRLWDIAAGNELRRLPEHGKPVGAVAFAPGGTVLASVDGDGVLRLWDVATGKTLRQFQADTGVIRTFAFSPDGKVLATGEEGSGMVRLWDAAAGKELRRWPASHRYVSGLAFTPDGNVLATAGKWDHAIRLWEAATGKELQPVAGHTGMVEWLRFTADNRTMLSGGRDSKVLEWDLATGRERRRLVGGPPGPGEAIYPATITSDLSPDGATLARANRYTWDPKDAVIRLWDTATGKELRALRGHEASIVWVRFAPGGKLLASGGEDGTRVWDVATGKELYHLPGNGGGAFSPDGRWLAGAGQTDRTIRLWEAATGKEVRRWENGQEDTWRLHFSPDGRFLASSGMVRSGIGVWEVATGKQVLALGTGGYIDALAFSADTRLLAATVRGSRVLAGGDREESSTILLWEVRSGQEIRRMAVSQGWVWTLAFAPDGRTLASGGGDSTILLWDLTGRKGKAGSAAPTPGELAGLWADLAGGAVKADRALWALALAPGQSVPFLEDRLRPAAPADAKQVGRWLSDLESKSLAVRQTALRTLEDLGEAAEPAVRKALEGAPTLEVRQQLELLLSKRAGEEVRRLRAIAALEYAGTAEARRVLAGLAQATPNPRVAQAAWASWQRLGERP
jgi:RNA polymerase sigma factor (sigma-70 family)